jgi:uncharacterized protein (DUF1015 family)
MAEVSPFRGVRYAAEIDLRDVVSPPYDVIDPAEAAALRARSQYNAIHVDMPAGDGDVYAGAASLFSDWRRDGVLHRDDESRFYLIDQTFRGPDGFERTRRGFAGRLRLADFSERVVLPHEMTHEGPKRDRLALLRATHANMSQIFMLYPDDKGEISAALAAAPSRRAAKVTDRDGAIHRLRIVGGEAAARIAALLAAETVYIADGHHRYATALAYRNERRAAGDHSADHVLAYFCSMNDPGLTVFPTHRLLKGIELPPMDEVIDRLRPTFEVFPERGADRGACQMMAGHLRSFGDRGKVFGLYFPHESACVTVELRDPASVGRLVERGFSPAAAHLSVTILHQLIFRDALGIDPAQTEGKIDYVADPSAAFDLLSTGNYSLGAFLNPTLVSEVREVADAGETMPHKSTYFFPKLLTGLVFDALGDGD